MRTKGIVLFVCTSEFLYEIFRILVLLHDMDHIILRVMILSFLPELWLLSEARHSYCYFSSIAVMVLYVFFVKFYGLSLFYDHMQTSETRVHGLF